MSTFKEWQVANLSPEQQVECNALCIVEADRMIQLGVTPNPDGETVFTSPEIQQQFNDGQSAGFKQYYAQFNV